jgi:AraC family transcriptional regulator
MTATAPAKATINSVKLTHKTKYGGIEMTPYIIEMTPFTAAGRTNRQKIPNVKRTADIPAFDFDPRAGVGDLLDNTNKLFPKSKHCEIEMCYDFDLNTGEFIYFAGRGVTHPDDIKNILPDMASFEINGLYAIFSTPLVPFEEREKYAQTIRATWNYILTEWLPNSEFEYDVTRKDFEYYDYRSHGWYFDGKKQGDICIPIRQREEAKRKARERGREFWDAEMKLREK